MCTPTPSDLPHRVTEESPTIEELVSANTQDKEDEEIDSFFKEEKDDGSKHECENISVKTELKYLETDIDQLETSKQLVQNTEEMSLIELMDVRSPSYQITRTPIMVSFKIIIRNLKCRNKINFVL